MSADHYHLMDEQNLLTFHNNFPYHQFPFTHSDSNHHQLPTLTPRFTRSASLQQPLFNFKEKQVYTGSPEPNSGWSGSSHSKAPSPPQFIKTDEDALKLLYAAAASKVTRTKLIMNNKGPIGVPQAFEHHHRSPYEVELFHSRRNKGTVSSAWPPVTAKTGTGVFLPRRYNPPESGKRQACSYADQSPGMFQSSTTSFVPVNASASPQQAHYEWLMGRRKAMILGGQQEHRQGRNNIESVVMEPAVNNPAVLLPQEWTY